MSTLRESPTPRVRFYDCAKCYDLGCIHCFTTLWTIATWWRSHPDEGALGYAQLVADEPDAWGHCSTGAPS